MLIYDCEIKKAIAKNGESRLADVEYCAGWRDFENMGISCIGAYDYDADRYRLFMEDNFDEFDKLVAAHDVIVGFNSIGFDNELIKAARETPVLMEVGHKSYDILVEIWKGAGLGPKFEYPSHMGFGLDACCKANFGTEKSGHGAVAPVDYQRGNYGRLVDYCLNDVVLTKQLMDRILERGEIVDPRDGASVLQVAPPQLRTP